MTVVRIGEHNEIVVPKEVLDAIGAKPGDLVETRFERVIEVPYTDEVLGPEAEASIREGLKDIDEGRVSPPMRTWEESREYLRKLRER